MTDDAKVWMAFIAAALAFIGTAYTAIMNYISRREQDTFNAAIAAAKAKTDKELADLKSKTDIDLARLNAELQSERDRRMEQVEAEKVVSKFRDPLLHAAYDLQSRIYNLLRGGFLNRYYTNGSDREKNYAVENTVFLVAQFLGWTELVRQEIQFLDAGNEAQTQELRALQDSIYTQFHSDALGTGFRLFPGEQRAVGELMIDRAPDIPRCIGFAAFLKSRNPDIDQWLDPLRDDVKQMSLNMAPFEKRLVKVQHSLIDLLQFLDPDCIWFPAHCRSKI